MSTWNGYIYLRSESFTLLTGEHAWRNLHVGVECDFCFIISFPVFLVVKCLGNGQNLPKIDLPYVSSEWFGPLGAFWLEQGTRLF